jgi:hypothetical protein
MPRPRRGGHALYMRQVLVHLRIRGHTQVDWVDRGPGGEHDTHRQGAQRVEDSLERLTSAGDVGRAQADQDDRHRRSGAKSVYVRPPS